MKVITLEPSSLSQKNERMQLNDAEGWKEGESSKLGVDAQRLAISFKSWLYEFLLSGIIHLALNPFTAWFWAPFIYFLS
jgi:hypothetical protein